MQPAQIPLQSLPTLQQIDTPTQLGVICRLTEGALNPVIQIIDKDENLPGAAASLVAPPRAHTSFAWARGTANTLRSELWADRLALGHVAHALSGRALSPIYQASAF